MNQIELRPLSARRSADAALPERVRNAITTFREHRRDPEDVAKGVHYLDAFGLLFGRGDVTMLARMTETPLGRRLLDERHEVLDLLRDRDWLLSLPEESLGYRYARFAIDRGLFPERLADVVRELQQKWAHLCEKP